MKREIKFRAWDKDMREMVSVSGVQFDEHSPHEDPCIIDQHNDIRDLEDVELMQFTGLHDKNGKEIYEGDILKLQYPINYRFAGIIDNEIDNEITVAISFDSGCFWFTGDGYTDCNWHFYNKYEVIGNIYENPELLNQ